MGIEAIDDVLPKFQRRPAFVTATGFNHIPGVAAALIGKANQWTCIALLDIPCTGELADYTKAPEWKNNNGYVHPFAFAEWGLTAIDDRIFWGSTRQAGLHGQWDATNGGLPYESTSNKLLSMTALVQPDGTPLPLLSIDQANFLTSNGIGTFINVGGWRAWGVETTAFPGNTDIKDSDRSVRRMFCFARAVIEMTMFQEVAKPISPRLRDRIMLTSTELMNLWTSRAALIAGHVEFNREDNPNISLLSGELLFQIFITPPNAAKAITFSFTYDPSGLEKLFE
jgi:phage tail sheath protein FI